MARKPQIKCFSHLAVKAFLRLERSQEALLKVMASSGWKITPLSGEMFILKVFFKYNLPVYIEFN